VPALATDWRWATPLVAEFDLRRGVTFHNGEPFDAGAVKYSFERMAAISEGFNWVQAIIPEFERVEVVNSHRVRFHFRRHNNIFFISSRFFVILPPKFLKEQGAAAFRARPVGTGAFMVSAVESDAQGVVRRVGLVRNPAYWRTGFPRLERLEFVFGLTQEEALAKLAAGELEAMGDLPIRRILDAKKSGLKVMKKGQGLISWLYFNLTEYKREAPVWKNDVRKAIMHAIDYDKILHLVYRDRAKVNHQWAFPGLPGYVAGLPNYEFNPDKARQLLAAAGYPNGFSMNVYCDDVSLDEAKIVKSSLAAIGIAVNIEVLDEAANNGVLTARKKPQSPYHEKLKFYDMMIGDFGWGLPHNYVGHLHTFSLDSFCTMVADDYPGAERTVAMFEEAKSTFGETAAEKKWAAITACELDRLSVAGLVLKDTYYATVAGLEWQVYGSYDFTRARFADPPRGPR
jgi:peptide/nickel transport system substrate-binding protein